MVTTGAAGSGSGETSEKPMGAGASTVAPIPMTSSGLLTVPSKKLPAESTVTPFPKGVSQGSSETQRTLPGSLPPYSKDLAPGAGADVPISASRTLAASAGEAPEEDCVTPTPRTSASRARVSAT